MLHKIISGISILSSSAILTCMLIQPDFMLTNRLTGAAANTSPQQSYANRAVTSGTCGENVTWNLDASGTLTISGTGAMEDQGIEGVSWTDVRDDIKKIVIQDGVTTIGQCAFESCTSLESVTIPDSVKSIQGRAFCNCTSLKSITIPDSVTEFGGQVFLVCTALESITIPDNIKELSPGILCGCSALKSVTLPDDIRLISDGALCDCSSLESIIIKNPKCEIQDSADEGGEYGYTIYETTTIYGYTNSTAHTYAKKYNRKFVALDEIEETTAPTEPITTEPIVTEPIATEPIVTEPIATEPVATEPIATEPITTEPITIDTYDVGDLDGNGFVNATDAAIILQYAAESGSGKFDGTMAEYLEAIGIDTYNASTLINADTFNAMDAAIILQYAAESGSGKFSGTMMEYLKAQGYRS